ncbi:GNAT family N-acetyltransferase [Mariniluteicoccus endophyticus]
MDAYTTGPLTPATWPDFAELIERNNGVYGGCWCIAYHTPQQRQGLSNREAKLRLVEHDSAHAALVYDTDGKVQGWAQYGPPAELEGFKHKREYEKEPPARPDWRIACVFVDKQHRGQGVARTAITGAFEQIAAAGGGLVEAISEVTDGRNAQPRFLFTATAELLEELGFSKIRQVGKHAWILSRTVEASN